MQCRFLSPEIPYHHLTPFSFIAIARWKYCLLSTSLSRQICPSCIYTYFSEGEIFSNIPGKGNRFPGNVFGISHYLQVFVSIIYSIYSGCIYVIKNQDIFKNGQYCFFKMIIVFSHIIYNLFDNDNKLLAFPAFTIFPFPEYKYVHYFILIFGIIYFLQSIIIYCL